MGDIDEWLKSQGWRDPDTEDNQGFWLGAMVWIIILVLIVGAIWLVA